MRFIVFWPAALLSAALAHGQTAPRHTFEVASVKPAAPDEKGGGYRFDPGRTVVSNFTLKNLICLAWHIQDFEVTGGPAWADSDSARFDIEARADGNPGEGEARAMLQSLLDDRFHLVLRREVRDLPIYSLQTARSDARPAPGLVRWQEGTCTPRPQDFPPPLAAGEPPYCGFAQRFRLHGKDGPSMELQGSGVTLDLLARTLGNLLERHVANDTGIEGAFDLKVEYAPDRDLLSQLAPDAQPADPALSLPSALQEQLGLRLVSRKGPVEVFVVDHAEKPSEN